MCVCVNPVQALKEQKEWPAVKMLKDLKGASMVVPMPGMAGSFVVVELVAEIIRWG